MPGSPLRKMRKKALDASITAARLTKEGDPKAAEAVAEAARLADLVMRMNGENPDPQAFVQAHAEVDTPRPANTGTGCGEKAASVEAVRVRRSRAKTAKALVGSAVNGVKAVSGEDVEAEAGVLAAEMAIQGVRDPALMFGLPSLPPEPLEEAEAAMAKAVVQAAMGEDSGGRLLASGPGWLADAFPALTEDEAVRAARYLVSMATQAARAPSLDETSTVAEIALSSAGISFAAFEGMRQRDGTFDRAQEAVTAARKRAVMNLLEERLWQRAYDGQEEDVPTRGGDVVTVRRFDNVLAFNLLKYGHDKYAKQQLKDKAEAAAMSLVIGRAAAMSLPPEVPSQPKAVEAVCREVKP